MRERKKLVNIERDGSGLKPQPLYERGEKRRSER